MKHLFRRLVGTMMIIAAIGGLLFSLIGLGMVWYFKPAATETLLADLRLASDTLDTTADGLAIAWQSLNTSTASITALQNSLEATAETIDRTTPLVNTLVGLTRDDLPNAVSAAQTSLVSAQESARIIDSVLRALTSIPFVPDDLYSPPIPLHESLQQVAESMQGLPEAFDTIEESLLSAGNNLEVVQVDFRLMAADILEIQTSLEEAQSVVNDYQALVADMQMRVDRQIERLPGLLNLLAWVITFILAWTAVAQIGLLLQGWNLLQQGPVLGRDEYP